MYFDNNREKDMNRQWLIEIDFRDMIKARRMSFDYIIKMYIKIEQRDRYNQIITKID